MIVSRPMRSALALLLALLAAACQATVPPTSTPPSATPGATSTPSATVSASATLATRLDADAAIKAEAAAFPDEYCGTYRDPGGALVSLWKANPDQHLAAITASSDGATQVAVKGCRFSMTELLAVQDEISTDVSVWLLTIPARVIGVAVDETNDRIELEISSGVGDAADRVVTAYTSRYGLPAGILVVESDGTGAALYGWGAVRVTVVGPGGKSLGPNDLSLDWISNIKGLRCGIGDVGFGVSPDGSTDLPCQVATWTIRVLTPSGKTVGSAKVDVLAGRSVPLTIRLSVVPAPTP
jgi:hypothetical protein